MAFVVGWSSAMLAMEVIGGTIFLSPRSRTRVDDEWVDLENLHQMTEMSIQAILRFGVVHRCHKRPPDIYSMAAGDTILLDLIVTEVSEVADELSEASSFAH